MCVYMRVCNARYNPKQVHLLFNFVAFLSIYVDEYSTVNPPYKDHSRPLNGPMKFGLLKQMAFLKSKIYLYEAAFIHRGPL